MEHLNKTTEQIMQVAGEGGMHTKMVIGMLVSGMAYDVARLCKNIRETSIDEADRLERIKLLAEQSGMEFTQLKQLCS
jgi:hypothetical protein